MKTISPRRTRLAFLLFILFLPLILCAQNQKGDHVRKMLQEKWHTIAHPFQGLPSPVEIQKRSENEYRFSDIDDRSRSEGEPFIAVNPTDSNHIVVSFMDLGFELDFPVYFSTDGGENWNKSEISVMDTFKSDFPELIVGGGGDPILAFDATGKLYFSWIYLGIEFTTGTVVTYWAWSENQGMNFQIAKGNDRYIEFGKINLFTAEIQNEGNGIFDRPWFAVDKSGGPHDGTLYCAGLFLPSDSTELEGEGLVLRMKRPGVDSFELAQTQVSLGVNAQFSNIAVDPGGRIHISYVDLDADQLMHALVKAGGTDVLSLDTVSALVGFSPIKVHSRENPAPSLIIDPQNYDTYLAWSDFSNELVQGFLSKSIDFGRTWSDPFLLNEALDFDLSQVLMPVIAINEKGHIALTYFGLDEADKGHYLISHTEDGGDSWKPPLIVSGDTTDFSTYSDSSFFGDYYKTEYVGNHAYIVWSDGRNKLGAKTYFSKIDPANPSVSVHPISSIQDHTYVSPVFPSPGAGQQFISIKAKFFQQLHMQVFSLDGRLLHQWNDQVQAGETMKEIPFSGPPGSYILVLRSDFFTTTRPFIIQ
jgi:hypothetical protein